MTAPTDLYERLLELSRLERELVAPEYLARLAEVQAERAELIGRLPKTAPPEARAALEEARFLVLETIVELSFAMDNARADLGHLGRGRAALASYANGPARSRLEATG